MDEHTDYYVQDVDYYAHPLAHVHASARIGEDSKIWQFASILRGATLGERCNVASGACIDGSHFGDDCIICHNVAMGPGFKFGNGCFIGPNVTICNDAWPTSSKEGFSLREFDGEQWAVIGKDGCSVGANAVVLPGVILGRNSMVAAGAVCTRDVPDNHIYTRDNEIHPIMSKPTRMRFARD